MADFNPFLDPHWEPLKTAFAGVIERTQPRGMFQVQTYASKYNCSPETSPYIQGRWGEGECEVELASNLMLIPPLSSVEENELEFLGWTKPEVSPREYLENRTGNPNFVRLFGPEFNAVQIAELIISALVIVYGVEDQDYWGFEDLDEADYVDSLGLLVRLKSSAGNPNRVIFGLPERPTEEVPGERKRNLS